jgi:LacI family transcriptional regulator
MKQVALLIETSNAYARGLLRGVVAYIREHRPWSLYLAEHSRGDHPPGWLRQWRGDGIIARIETPAMAKALKTLKIPIVDVSAARLIPSLPWFETDDAAFARLAFEHLRERGFKRYAYCGDDRFNWSKWRAEHFQELAQAEGGEYFCFEPTRRYRRDDTALVEELTRWLRKLPKPIGLMACYDLRGQQVLDACRRAGIAVPDEVAVIAVDNDELLCELSHPPLSSVIPNTHQTGYKAAALLDELMAGRPLAAATCLIPPIGIATRQSTDVVAVEDRTVAMAMRFIREHAFEGINVQDVLRAVPQSRRRLESQFQHFFGRTPHEEILRVQVERAKILLLQTDLPLPEVAERAGFKHSEYLSVVLKRLTGLPPGQYRAQHRQG